MRTISLSEILPILEDKSAVIEAVKTGFIQYSQGEISQPAPVQMLFRATSQSLSGDCHVKTASSDSLPYFSIKVATGFYDNPSKGLPVNNGLTILMSSNTGEPLALFQDAGHLTSIRTAAAGALAASLVNFDHPTTLGVIGTGHQAELQARWISAVNPISKIIIWGRSETKAEALKTCLQDTGIDVRTASTISELCKQAKVIVTTTPSTSPVVFARDIRAGHHIIAMGSDSPGKVELEAEILKRADFIVTDDHAQCLHHGEFGNAVRAQGVGETTDISFGKILENPESLNLNHQSISVVDLTGLGAQDLAIASMVFETL